MPWRPLGIPVQAATLPSRSPRSMRAQEGWAIFGLTFGSLVVVHFPVLPEGELHLPNHHCSVNHTLSSPGPGNAISTFCVMLRCHPPT